MARLLVPLMLLLTACGGGGGGSSSEGFTGESETVSEDATPDDTPPAEEPMEPADPTGSPSMNTISAAKYFLAPCASPLVFDMPAKMRVGSDVMVVKLEGTKKTLALNGADLWEATPALESAFAFDVNVKVLGAEAIYPSYLCNSIVTSYPDDAHPDDQRGTVEIDANGATATVTWHTRRENDRDLVYKIEVMLPGGGAPVVFE